MDNYATHKTAAVEAWLARRPHWYVHFTPTSASWINASWINASWVNQVERWFAELTCKQLQRGVHTSTRQLEADIRAFIEQHNEDPKAFKWTKSAADIPAAVKRFCLRVNQNLCHEPLDSGDCRSSRFLFATSSEAAGGLIPERGCSFHQWCLQYFMLKGSVVESRKRREPESPLLCDSPAYLNRIWRYSDSLFTLKVLSMGQAAFLDGRLFDLSPSPDDGVVQADVDVGGVRLARLSW